MDFSLGIYFVSVAICSVIFCLLHLFGKNVPQTKLQDLARKLVRFIAQLFYFGACAILLFFLFTRCEHILFFKLIWAVLHGGIVLISFFIASAFWTERPDVGWPYEWKDTPLVDREQIEKTANYTVSEKKYIHLENNPVLRKVIESARQLDAAAILCEPDCVKIYKYGTISPLNERVFVASDYQDNSNVTHSGEKKERAYYQQRFDRLFYTHETPDGMIHFQYENFPSMSSMDQRNFSAVIARLLGDGYVVLEHTGVLHWDTTKEDYVGGDPTYSPAPNGGFTMRAGGGKVMRGNSGSIHGFYTSVVKKELNAACAENKVQREMRITALRREQAMRELNAQKNKW